MNFFDRFKKRLTKEQHKELEKAREELRKTKEQLEKKDNDIKRLSEMNAFEVDLQLKKQIERREKKENETHLEQEQVTLNRDSETLNKKDDEPNEKFCYSCQKKLVWPDINSCYYCKKNYCGDHRLAENHECPKVMAAKHIEKDYVRKKGVNITTARFAVICKSCGFSSDYGDIEKMNQIRIEHIRAYHCKSETVQLRQHEEDRKADDEFIRKTYPTEQGNTWMYGCLQDAKKIIEEHHKFEGISELFHDAKFSIFIQYDRENAYGYIDGAYPFYRIGIHRSLEKNSVESYKMVTVVLIHELLHALHGNWSESQVYTEENRLANLGLHFDAIQNLELLYLSGKMRLCGR